MGQKKQLRRALKLLSKRSREYTKTTDKELESLVWRAELMREARKKKRRELIKRKRKERGG